MPIVPRPFVLRIPRKLVYSAILVTTVLVGLEVRQRSVESRKWGRRNARPYSLCLETAQGRRYDPFQRGTLTLSVAPYLVYANKAGQRTRFMNVNAQGFRGRDWTLEKPEGALRVVLLGGSTAFGFGATDDDAVHTAVLERLLRAAPQLAGRTVEVWNAGVVGYDSTQEMILLSTRVLDYRPDVVVLFDAYNDFNYSGVYRPGAREIVQPRFFELDQRVADGSRPWLVLMRCSAFYRRIEEIVREYKERHGGGIPYRTFYDNVKVASVQYRRNLERMTRLAKASGVAIVLAPQPEIFHRRGEIPAPEQELRETFTEWGYADYARSQYPLYVAAAEEVARRESVPFVDTSAAFDAVPDHVFTDGAHLTDRGNELVARCLLPTLVDLLARP